jgi:nucleotide-binding universal stress UspA family protein
VQALDVPVAVVPPHLRAGAVRRALVAVEGDGESPTLRHFVRRLSRTRELEMIALHVLTPDRLPMFGDQPVHETEAWTQEFSRRVLSPERPDVQLEVRVGDAPQTVRRMVQELDADLVVLAWRRNLGSGHGQLVRTMLAESEVPVLLFPLA